MHFFSAFLTTEHRFGARAAGTKVKNRLIHSSFSSGFLCSIYFVSKLRPITATETSGDYDPETSPDYTAFAAITASGVDYALGGRLSPLGMKDLLRKSVV